MRITRLGGRLTARALSAVLLTVALTATGLLVASPPKARAFAEDVCYTPGAPPHSCAPLPFACPPSDAHDPICGARAFFRYGYTLRQPLGGRSLVHTDSTYIMARKIGFSLQDAYWIAAYSEATDLGTFRPRDMRGNPVPNAAALTTKDISGLVRTHFKTGGFLFHFLPTMRGPRSPLPNGLRPDVDDPRHEVMLTHIRRWAMEGPGSNAPLCTGGFTDRTARGDYATGTTCYGGPNPAPINGKYSLVDPIPIPFQNVTGRQVISDGVTSERFDAHVGPQSANARIGIYVHALGDRISHHECTDEGTIAPPAQGRRSFDIDLLQPDCDQGPHAVRHEYETGVDFHSLDPHDRTTEAALSMVYDELVNFARVRGVLNAEATTPAAKKSVVSDGLLPALERRNPEARIRAVTAVGCRLGVPAFPGSPRC
ncbi:hypothetical protein [Gordonia paraffinivorans]|nr:hypothetical protein [Gordonia paraffinivorans]